MPSGDSNLAVTRSTILDAIGEDQSWGPSYSDWSSQAVDVTRAQRWIDGGLNWFYSPPPIRGERAPHVWSFLFPSIDIQLSSGVYSYSLPDDFGGWKPGTTHLFFRNGDNGPSQPVELTSVVRIRSAISSQRGRDSVSLGPPEMAASISLGSDGTEGQRHVLEVYPTPDSDNLVLTAEYYSNPYQLTASKPYPMGGQPHGNCILAAVYAYIEFSKDKIKGPRYEAFLDILTSSVWHDRRLIQSAKQYGRNIDHSRGIVGTRRSSGLVTYEGQTYEG